MTGRRSVFRAPAFWIAFVVLSAIGAGVAVRVFPEAMPFVTLDLDMDREAAIARARELAVERGWEPGAGAEVAASFRTDSTTQAYVESEVGGNSAFQRMLHEGLYSPYTWRVRLFREHEAAETTVAFTPAGEPYGFSETLREDAPGADLDAEAARAIAEREAARWGVDLGPFDPLEASQEERPGGRVDHTFVYERREPRVGEGSYRLRLEVAGDRFTGFDHFVRVPEAFERRYDEMRSKNDLVAGVANGGVFLLYGAGVLFGLVQLSRRREVLWRPALVCAGVIGALMLAAQLSQWPLLWMDYDTALSSSGFALQQVVFALVQSLFLALAAGIVFAGGEALSRRAFPGHPQLFRAWSLDAARSRTVLGGTLAAYLILGLMFAYVSLLYTYARQTLGWWMPSSALTDPDVVAGYLPWLFPIAVSLQAGFVEEVMFRAVPLAGARLLGERFGGTRYWMGATLLLQAVLFGAVHANYPAQPAYARIVEISIPFVFIGLLYIAFGLLPAIVMHFAFDVVFFSMPLFASAGPGAWLDRALVVGLGLLPLWVVVGARLRGGAWIELPDALRNHAWRPPEAPTQEEPAAPAVGSSAGVTVGAERALLAAGVLGLIAWTSTTSFTSDVPPVVVSREAARAAAREALGGRGIDPGSQSRVLTATGGDPFGADPFVWEEAGADTYRQVVGRFLEAPHWRVRYARFEGDVAERAEELTVHVSGDGEPYRVERRLPEDRPGPRLEIEAARRLALDSIAEDVGLDTGRLEEVSAEPAERPARRDWTFTFRDPSLSFGEAGEARVLVEIAGDDVLDVMPHVFVPEDWRREAQERAAMSSLATIVCSMLFFGSLLVAMVVALIRWSRGAVAKATFVRVFAGLFVLLLLRAANDWPLTAFGFDTSRPFAAQTVLALGAGLVGAVFLSAIVALTCGMLHAAQAAPATTSGARRAVRGVALGLALVAAAALGAALSASRPVWGDLAPAGSASSTFAVLAAALRSLALRGAFLLLAVTAASRLTGDFTRRRPLGLGLLLLAGVITVGGAGVRDVPAWLGSGIATGLVLCLAYVFAVRQQPSLLPFAVATLLGLSVLREGILGAYPGAPLAAGVALVALAAAAWWWSGRLESDARGDAPTSSP